MRVLASTSPLCALLIALACAPTASAATETVALGAAEETGPEPSPFLEPPEVENPISFRVTYTATPIQPLLIGQTLYCTRGSEHPGVPEETEIVTPPYSATLTAPSGSQSCKLFVQEEPPVATTVFGTVRIEAEATRVAKAPPPAAGSKKQKKCKKGRRLKHGKCVKKASGKHRR